MNYEVLVYHALRTGIGFSGNDVMMGRWVTLPFVPFYGLYIKSGDEDDDGISISREPNERHLISFNLSTERFTVMVGETRCGGDYLDVDEQANDWLNAGWVILEGPWYEW